MIPKLIWRNLWRNKRRTLITTSSVSFAVFLAVLMNALIAGMFGNLLDGIVGGYSGHVQVHAQGYWDEPSLELLLDDDPALRAELKGIPGVAEVAPRLETFMLVSADTLTRGAMVAGIDPAKEERLMKLGDRIIRGTGLPPDGDAAVLSEGLARRLGADVGDTIVLLGQGYHGSMAAGKYAVRGIVRFASPGLNDGLLYLPLPTAQELLPTPGMVSTWAFALEGMQHTAPVRAALEQRLGDTHRAMDWKEMMPEVDNHIRSEEAGIRIIVGILYLIVAFGIFGTILMMLNERTYEFGMLLAIGMGRRLLATVVMAESVLLSLVGVLVGGLIAIPVVWALQERPIRLTGSMARMMEDYGFESVMPTALEPAIFLEQTLVVLAIALVLGIYPWRHVSKLLPLNAMKR